MSAREPEICEIKFHSLQQGLQMELVLKFTRSLIPKQTPDF